VTETTKRGDRALLIGPTGGKLWYPAITTLRYFGIVSYRISLYRRLILPEPLY
jgi:hypothetical protein